MSNIKIIFQLFCLLFLSCSEQEEYILNPTDSVFNSSLNIAGQNNTLDIVTWNIERFPKNNFTNLYVKQIIDSLNVDIFGLQEIESIDYFNDLLDSLGDNWHGYRSGGVNSNWGELSYIINTSNIEVTTNPYTILDEYEHYFAYRTPYVMKFVFADEEFVLINVHFKCCSDTPNDPDNSARRQAASEAIYNYINQ